VPSSSGKEGGVTDCHLRFQGEGDGLLVLNLGSKRCLSAIAPRKKKGLFPRGLVKDLDLSFQERGSALIMAWRKGNRPLSVAAYKGTQEVLSHRHRLERGKRLSSRSFPLSRNGKGGKKRGRQPQGCSYIKCKVGERNKRKPY